MRIASPIGVIYRAALDALRWLIEGGPGPLTGAMVGLPVSAHAVIRELAAAEELIYGRPSKCRDYASGFEHALVWAQFATAAPPVPARSGDPAPNTIGRSVSGEASASALPDTPLPPRPPRPPTRSART